MTHRLVPLLSLAALALSVVLPVTRAAENVGGWTHAMAIVGEPKYAEGFARFDYVNPEAPKGGHLDLSEMGSFDTLNPLPAKGDLAVGLGLVLEPLMMATEDEIATSYGLLAEAVKYPADFSSVTFRLRQGARWHDGEPVTVEDVIWSFEQTVENNPSRQIYYRHVKSAEKTGAREVTFTFDEVNNRELPKIVGDLLIHPRHWWESEGPDGEKRDISATTLEPIMGSGPYRISSVRPGDSMTFERVEDYWGADLNVNVGRHNFASIQYTYFGDRNVEFESFKAGDTDFWSENEAKRWATAYDFPAATNGEIIREEVDNPYRSVGVMVGFIPNQRRARFQDQRVRQALNYAFDFETLNRSIFYGQYQRISSYFHGTELAASGLPTGRELEILESVRDKLPERVFTQPYENPVAGDRTQLRENLRKAVELFKQAGYELRGSQMVNAATGEPFTLEILLNSPIIERVALPYTQTLKLIGIAATVRSVDSAEYTNRLRSRDFDVTYNGWGQSLSPGNEQREYWGTEAADREGSLNYAGIKNEAIDTLVRQVVLAKDRDDLVAATRALDRALLAHHYVIPSYTRRSQPIAYWTKLQRPAELPHYGLGFPDAWWMAKER
ncbi:extracellular solute-binding protein [Pseudohoeflea coraliihabitans]|uniref:Extracellular solute-binding protein n=1 Tax=Pseudohoeflea coraliihabitans TaxID=2860393 RepID=A0ABS6WRV1_9HYPH|nr:extracellular solute-binding protein [Pseudohoeflea sp. DP4N28-3]MBW3097769.1 extracellular solute-binding protein [Pseudohoeflea sp. DP4N28-3]